VVTTIFITLIGIVFWPVRIVLQKFRNRGQKKIPTDSLKKKRVIIYGIDGIDPSLVRKFIKEGVLPNFKRLADGGTFSELRSTYPPESPVAWSSFITGSNPGRHGIFDFLHRDLKTYLPTLSMAEIRAPEKTIGLGKYRIPLSAPKVLPLRKGTPFWKWVSDHGIYTTVLRVPVTFPPEPFQGVLLSSMGIPDLRGTQGTFSFFTPANGSQNPMEGGEIIRIQKNGPRIQSHIVGPEDTSLKRSGSCRVPIEFETNGTRDRITIRVQNNTLELGVGEWSDWVEVAFPMSFGSKAHGICKFYLNSLEPEFELYQTPINIHPEKPAIPISYPNDYAKYLSKSIGLFNTLGIQEDTWSLNEEKLDETTFLDHCYQILHERERIFFHELENFRKGLLVNVFDTVDRVQHMFWRHMDPSHPNHDKEKAEKYGNVIRDLYIYMDDLLGKVLERVDKNTTLMILSDHGFKPFRYVVHLNTFLFKNGFIGLKDESKGESGQFFRNFDWSKTKAYSLGLGGIYINQKGREPLGIVERGEETEKVKKEIIRKLEEFVDPVSQQKPVHKVYRREDLYQGKYVEKAPDLVVGFAEGYRSSWQTSLGGAPANPPVEINRMNWSGDHCMDPSFVPGIFMANRKLSASDPCIWDLAPTTLHQFNIDIPEEMDGKVLF